MIAVGLLGRCAQTGSLGYAVLADRRAIGAFAPALEKSVGAALCFGVLNPLYRDWMLKGLTLGLTPDEAIIAARSHDRHELHRQAIILDHDGIAAARTGKKVVRRASHYVEQDLAVAGCGLRSSKPVEEIVRVFQSTRDLPLGNRLVGALEMAVLSGAELSGEPQSAAVKTTSPNGDIPPLDFRVDSHKDAVAELRRIFDGVTQKKKKAQKPAKSMDHVRPIHAAY